MSRLLALIGREWNAFWYSPMAYAVGGFWLLLQGLIFSMLIALLNDPRVPPWLKMNHLFFGAFFYWLSVLIVCPLLTMRTFSEEKRTGTMEVLLSAPVTDVQVVLAKFLGAWLCYAALWLLTLPLFLLLRAYTPMDWAPVATGYLGTLLIGAVFLSMGVLASSLTRNQVIAAVIGFVLMLLLWSIGLLDLFVQDPESSRWIRYLSLMEHVQDFSKGIVDTRPLVFYTSVTAISLFLTVRTVGSPRWRT